MLWFFKFNRPRDLNFNTKKRQGTLFNFDVKKSRIESVCDATYEGKSLNNRKFYTRNNFFTRVLTEIVCVLFFDTVPLLRSTLGPPAHKLADAL